MRLALLHILLVFGTLPVLHAQDKSQPFGADFPNLDSYAVGEWWNRIPKKAKQPKLLVPRDEVVAFAIYTHDRGVLKLTCQLYPLKPDEPRTVHLELRQSDESQWKVIQTKPVIYPGWSSHFRLENWDNSKDVQYRVRLGDVSSFEGLIRKDPVDKDEIVVGSLGCNSSRTPGPRPMIVENLLAQDPDLLFFSGDQTYNHTQHTYGWLEFGIQFRELLKDRPVITIPDDHDVGQANIWGENGKKAATPAGPQGGFFYPVDYVNMVQRCQTSHLPDPYDATPINRGIGVYYTSLRVGGIDFAILEDRKFKSGPEGKIPKMGPRPDHINDPKYDRKSVDLPELKLLGDRQLSFLDDWGQDWHGAEMKVVLSQTAFCGAVHLHGQPSNRLLADLDSNGWPQTGRNNALTKIRRAWAPHLCGDQHLAVLVQHGINDPMDGPYGFTAPAIVNTIYGRWWHPFDEKAGPNPVPKSPLPWTGQYEDGLGNSIRMLAYANPVDRSNETQRADGYGLVRFRKSDRKIEFECWPRFIDVTDKGAKQFPGWPVSITAQDNDGRKVVGHLPLLKFENVLSPVVQVVNEDTEEVLYTIRANGDSFLAPVYQPGNYTVKIGRDQPNQTVIRQLNHQQGKSKEVIEVRL